MTLIEFIVDNCRHVVCKFEIPLKPWTTEEIEEVLATTNQEFLQIEGDDPDVPFGDDSILEQMEFINIGTSISGRKIWRKRV